MSDPDLQVDPVAFAYLQQATIEIISEQSYQPSSTEDFNAWLEENHVAIARRASNLNQEFYLKFVRNKMLMLSVLGAKVYYTINRQLLLEQEAESIEQILKDECIDRACDEGYF